MKKLWILIIAVIFIAGLAIGCGGGGGQQAEAPAPAPAAEQPSDTGTQGDASVQGKKVVFQCAGTAAPFCAAQALFLQQEADKYGWDLTIQDGGLDALQNTKDLEDAIAMNPDVIITMPIDSAAMSAGYKKAAEAGIPMINDTITCLEEDEQYMMCFNGPNNFLMSAAAAEMMNEALGGKGKIVMLTTQPGQTTTTERTVGFVDRLEELGSEIEIIATQNSDSLKDRAVVAMADLITKFGDQIEGVYTQEDSSAVGAYLALSESSIDPASVIIQSCAGNKEGLAAIVAGQIYGTVLHSASLSMEQAAALANEIMTKGLKYPQQLDKYWQYIPIPKVNAQNVEEYLPGDW